MSGWTSRCRQDPSGHRLVNFVWRDILSGGLASIPKLVKSIAHLDLVFISQLLAHRCSTLASSKESIFRMSSTSLVPLSKPCAFHVPFDLNSPSSSQDSCQVFSLSPLGRRLRIPGTSLPSALAAICVRCEICRVGCLVSADFTATGGGVEVVI